MFSFFIICLVIFIFLSIFIFKYKEFNSLDIIDKIIYICICFFIIWGTITLYYLICMFYKFITGGEIPLQAKYLEKTKYNIILYTYYLISFIILVILIVLIHIFIFWMLIIIFVPFIILIPIPIIPFIIPIPLKTILLEVVPPFKRLTERGILPLFRRIVFTLFNKQGIKDKFKDIFVNTYGFFYEELKLILSDLTKLNEPEREKISKGIQDDKYKTTTIDDDTDNEKNAKDAIEGTNEKLTDKLKDEFNICLKTTVKFTEYGDKSFNYENKMGELNCNFDKLKNYLKNIN